MLTTNWEILRILGFLKIASISSQTNEERIEGGTNDNNDDSTRINDDDDDDTVKTKKGFFYPLTSVDDVTPLSIILQLPKFPH